MTRKQLLNDLKFGLMTASFLVPFPFLGLFDAPFWAWLIYFGWMALAIYANVPRKKQKKREFRHFDLREDDAA